MTKNLRKRSNFRYSSILSKNKKLRARAVNVSDNELVRENKKNKKRRKMENSHSKKFNNNLILEI